jgi:serine/threonine protein kinase
VGKDLYEILSDSPNNWDGSTNQDLNILEPGTLVGRVYRIMRCLEIGRMGVVYVSEVLEDDLSPPPLVAVKMLFPSIVADGESNPLFVRFHREVDALFRVAHPNVVGAIQFIGFDNHVGYSMEYVDGGDLSRILASQGPFDEQKCIEVLMRIGRGLEAIHRAGVIHRDLKPENILVTRQGEPKISDFGVAYCGYGQRLTTKGSIVGTLSYLSPEYLEKGIVVRQGDVYALGAIGYEMLVGEPPFWGLNLCETIESKVSRPPPDPREKRSAVSRALSEIIMKALATNVDARFRTASEFCDALKMLVGSPISSPRSRHLLDRVDTDSKIEQKLHDDHEVSHPIETADSAVKATNNQEITYWLSILLFALLAGLIIFLALSR